MKSGSLRLTSVGWGSHPSHCLLHPHRRGLGANSSPGILDSTENSGILSRMFGRIALLSTALCCSLSGSVTSEGAFDALKALQGAWRIEEQAKPLTFEMSYAVGSNQSIVTEQFGKELSVFYLNGHDLEMIHFCNRGNQPPAARRRLRIERSTI